MTLVGQDANEGVEPTSSLAIPMMLMCVITVLRKYGDSTLAENQVQRSLAQIMLHVKPAEKVVLETVGINGAPLRQRGSFMTASHAITQARFWILPRAACSTVATPLRLAGSCSTLPPPIARRYL